MTFDTFPTAFLFLAAAMVIPALPQRLRGVVLVGLPALAAWQVWVMPMGNLYPARLMGLELELMRVDKLSRIFGLIFALMAFLGNLYAWHVRDTIQQVAALIYAGAAIGAVFAGDLITLFIWWEGTAIASVFLIWARRTEGAFATGMRYLIWQVGSGVLLLAGAALYWRETGSLDFTLMTLGSPATWLIFLAFGIKAAFPLLHNWLQDAYPAATVTGSVILSAFTTKLAIYALARGFAGTEILIYIGAIMTVFPLFFSEIENDMRRVLAYSLNNQLGFMVVGIGLGTEMALNGAISHAFAHILYKALLFMGMGAVLFRTGTVKATDLGGLYRTMPLTTIFTVVGAVSISAFPLFSGFVTKSLTLAAAGEAKLWLVWATLVFASVGVLSDTGIKIPYFAFFAHDSGKRPAEAPRGMLIAMGLTAALCILIGVRPGLLYALLPYEVEGTVYTATHVVGQLQLLLFAMLAFVLSMRLGLHPGEHRATILDTDWSYRRAGPVVVGAVVRLVNGLWQAGAASVARLQGAFLAHIRHSEGPEGRLAHVWPTGSMVQWLAIILGVALVVVYLT